MKYNKFIRNYKIFGNNITPDIKKKLFREYESNVIKNSTNHFNRFYCLSGVAICAIIIVTTAILVPNLIDFKKQPINSSNPYNSNTDLLDLSWYDDVVVVAGGVSGGISDGSDNFGLLNDAKTISFSQIPVYTDSYPADPAGVPLYDATKEQMKSLISDHNRFIQLLAPDVKVDYAPLDKNEFPFAGVSSTVDNMTIRTNVKSTIVSNAVLSVTSQTKLDDMLALLDSSPLLKAACAYLDITEPVVKLRKDYTVNGESSSSVFTVYSQETDALKNLYNSSLCTINVYFSHESETCGISILKPSIGEEKGIYDFISYETAIFNLKSGNYLLAPISMGIKPDDILGADIVYKADLKTGYYIPFYRFVCRSVDSEIIDADKTMYEYCYLPAVNFKG